AAVARHLHAGDRSGPLGPALDVGEDPPDVFGRCVDRDAALLDHVPDGTSMVRRRQRLPCRGWGRTGGEPEGQPRRALDGAPDSGPSTASAWPSPSSPPWRLGCSPAAAVATAGTAPTAAAIPPVGGRRPSGPASA